MKKKTTYDRLMAMSDEQRDAAVQCFDQEDLVIGKPLAGAMKEQWKRARRRGRPAKPAQQRAARVLVTLPPELLRKVDAYAQEHGISRAALVVQGLHAVLQIPAA